MVVEYLTSVRRLVSLVQWTVLAGDDAGGLAGVVIKFRRAWTRGLRILSDQRSSTCVFVISD